MTRFYVTVCCCISCAGSDDSVGFVTIREADNLNTLRCNGTYETTLTWTCDDTKIWSSASPNVTDFVRTVTKGLSDCYVSVFIRKKKNHRCVFLSAPRI